MKKNISIILVFTLIIYSSILTAQKKLTEKDLADIQEVTLVFKEAAYYFPTMFQFYAALQPVSQTFTDTPAINCKFCLKRSLLCDELIVKVQAKAMEKVKGASDSVINETRKKMLSIYHEITQLLPIGSLDDIRKFMAKIAQEEGVPCEDCKKVEWIVEDVST